MKYSLWLQTAGDTACAEWLPQHLQTWLLQVTRPEQSLGAVCACVVSMHSALLVLMRSLCREILSNVLLMTPLQEVTWRYQSLRRAR